MFFLLSCSNIDGHLAQDAWGDLSSAPFAPNPDPTATGENIYLDYPTQYNQMPDGVLPTSFPPPFPDNGGVNPATGLPDAAGAGNKVVDSFEFNEAAQNAEGAQQNAAEAKATENTEPTPNTVDALSKLNMPAGVHIRIKA